MIKLFIRAVALVGCLLIPLMAQSGGQSFSKATADDFGAFVGQLKTVASIEEPGTNDLSDLESKKQKLVTTIDAFGNVTSGSFDEFQKKLYGCYIKFADGIVKFYRNRGGSNDFSQVRNEIRQLASNANNNPDDKTRLAFLNVWSWFYSVQIDNQPSYREFFDALKDLAGQNPTMPELRTQQKEALPRFAYSGSLLLFKRILSEGLNIQPSQLNSGLNAYRLGQDELDQYLGLVYSIFQLSDKIQSDLAMSTTCLDGSKVPVNDIDLLSKKILNLNAMKNSDLMEQVQFAGVNLTIAKDLAKDQASKVDDLKKFKCPGFSDEVDVLWAMAALITSFTPSNVAFPSDGNDLMQFFEGAKGLIYALRGLGGAGTATTYLRLAETRFSSVANNQKADFALKTHAQFYLALTQFLNGSNTAGFTPTDQQNVVLSQMEKNYLKALNAVNKAPNNATVSAMRDSKNFSQFTMLQTQIVTDIETPFKGVLNNFDQTQLLPQIYAFLHLLQLKDNFQGKKSNLYCIDAFLSSYIFAYKSNLNPNQKKELQIWCAYHQYLLEEKTNTQWGVAPAGFNIASWEKPYTVLQGMNLSNSDPLYKDWMVARIYATMKINCDGALKIADELCCSGNDPRGCQLAAALAVVCQGSPSCNYNSKLQMICENNSCCLPCKIHYRGQTASTGDFDCSSYSFDGMGYNESMGIFCATIAKYMMVKNGFMPKIPVNLLPFITPSTTVNLTLNFSTSGCNSHHVAVKDLMSGKVEAEKDISGMNGVVDGLMAGTKYGLSISCGNSNFDYGAVIKLTQNTTMQIKLSPKFTFTPGAPQSAGENSVVAMAEFNTVKAEIWYQPKNKQCRYQVKINEAKVPLSIEQFVQPTLLLAYNDMVYVGDRQTGNLAVYDAKGQPVDNDPLGNELKPSISNMVSLGQNTQSIYFIQEDGVVKVLKKTDLSAGNLNWENGNLQSSSVLTGCVGDQGAVYFIEKQSGKLSMLPALNEAPIDFDGLSDARAQGLSLPTTLVYDSQGLIYALDAKTNKLFYFNLLGTLVNSQALQEGSHGYRVFGSSEPRLWIAYPDKLMDYKK